MTQPNLANSVMGFCFLQQHPAKAAHLLECQPSPLLVDLFVRLPISVSNKLIEHLTPQRVADILNTLPLMQAIALIETLPLNLSAPLLRLVSPSVQVSILRSLPRKKALTLQQRLAHASDSVGAIMNHNIVCLKSYLSAQEAQLRIKALPKHRDPLRFAAVDAHFRFLGVLNPVRIFQAEGKTPLDQLIEKDTPKIFVNTKIATLQQHRERYRYDEHVVIDESGRPIGFLTEGQMASITPPHKITRVPQLFWTRFNKRPTIARLPQPAVVDSLTVKTNTMQPSNKPFLPRRLPLARLMRNNISREPDNLGELNHL